MSPVASCLEALKKALMLRDTLNDFMPDISTLGETAPWGSEQETDHRSADETP